jgi:hypothetical protein
MCVHVHQNNNPPKVVVVVLLWFILTDCHRSNVCVFLSSSSDLCTSSRTHTYTHAHFFFISLSLSLLQQVRQQETNVQLLVSMNTRAELQVRISEAVEGLSVVCISYYATGLVGYGFKGLNVWINNQKNLFVFPCCVRVLFGQ